MRLPLLSITKRLLMSLVLCSSLSQAGKPPLEHAPDWLVKTTDGQTLSLQQELHKGQKVVMLFWATWCRYCKQLLPEIQMLSEQMENAGEKVTFVTFNIWQNSGESASPLNYFLTQNIKLPLVMRADMIAAKYHLKTTPGIFIVAADREILYRYTPGSTTQEVVAQLEQTLSDTE